MSLRNKFWIDLSDAGKPIEVDTDENARFIAASPDMALALQAVRVELGDDENYERFKFLLRTVDAALKKAGEI